MIRRNGGRPVPGSRIMRTMAKPSIYGVFTPAFTRAMLTAMLANGALARCGQRYTTSLNTSETIDF